MSQYRLYDPLTARWNGVDALAEKYHSSGSYNYVLGNPVLMVVPDGRDTTVYVYFDSNSKYFYGKDGAKNREKLINSIQAIYQANAITVQIVLTSLSPEEMTKDPSLLDKTDQYIFFSAGTMSFESGVKGYTDGQFSFVNLKQLSFGGDAMYRSENGPEMGLIANTAAHESMHGYLTRAIGYLNTNNEAMGLDIEGHSVSGQNLMTGADRKNRSRSFINSRNISPTDRLTPNHQTAVSTYIKEHLSSFRTPPDYLNILLPRNYKY